MKILHIAKTVLGGTWIYQQVRVLCSLGFEVVVVLPSDTQGLAPRYKEAGATVIPLEFDFPARAPWRIPALLSEFRDIVEDVRPDVIHAHFVGNALMMRAALGKSSQIPRIFQVPGPLHLENRFFAKLDIASAGPQDHWIAGCRWTEQKYRALGISQVRVFLSYSGIDVTAFRDQRKQTLRRELGLGSDVPLAGLVCYIYAPKRFLGQRTGLKGHEDFIAALQIAQKTEPKLQAVIIGGAWNGAAPYEKLLRRLGQHSCAGYLHFLGTRTDVPALYPDLDVAVVASHSENVPYSAVEPLLSGVPVVATNVGGLPDLVQPGISGTLVPPRNPQALADGMLASLRNRAESHRLALQGQKMARRMFDVATTAREIAGIYELVASKRTVRRQVA